MLCVAEVKGQQILDALEWGARSVPGETGAFLQVSGLAYEINTLVDSPCQSDNKGMLSGIEGQRRVQNVMVGEDVLDPEKTYTVAGSNYIVDSLGGVIGREYSDPWGQGRITILE